MQVKLAYMKITYLVQVNVYLPKNALESDLTVIENTTFQDCMFSFHLLYTRYVAAPPPYSDTRQRTSYGTRRSRGAHAGSK
jgi:hypothetical protein